MLGQRQVNPLRQRRQTAKASLRPHQLPGRSRGLLVQAAASTVPVTVYVTKKVDYGECLKLVGNQPNLGDWDTDKAVSLAWTDGHVWKTTFPVPVGVDISFKIVRHRKDGSSTWEGGDNRSFKALGPEYALDIKCDWDSTSKTNIKAVPMNQQSQSSAQQAASSNGTVAKLPPAMMNGHHKSNNGSPATETVSSATATALSTLEGDARSTSAWVGAEPEFVRSRKDKGSRQGTWNADMLQGKERELVRRDEKADNWLSKLGLIKTLLVDESPMMRPEMEELVACYVYATWINTGAITCVESGGHHRPNHHANAALEMFRSLEWCITDAATGIVQQGYKPEARILAARRMHTRLPSISGEFRVSTPLTRIRDIAHRNDIPKELKDEIKHTLQNKLHRSAGPEDLVATEAMLARITAKPGQYPDAFIEEFKIFTKELREFFNASGLVDLLQQTLPALDDRHRAVVNQFCTAMAKLDSNGNTSEPGMDDMLAALFMGTQARCFYISGLASGLRNDVGDGVLAMRQRWRLSEIRIEDYMFVLLARIIGQLETAGGAGMLSQPGSIAAWRVVTDTLKQGLRNLGLGAYATRELLILENELEGWMSGLSNSGGLHISKEHALLGKAWAERVQWLASQFSDLVMSLYAAPAQRIGTALGLPSHMANIFGEAEVRASVAFQVSRLAGLMARALRSAAGMTAWDGLVVGDAYGRLVEVQTLSPEAMQQACQGHDDQVVLLVRQAEGDEEVGSLGRRLAGVVLCQDLPHLSHLGVRARQEKVVFATCDDKDYVTSTVRPLLGKHVKLSVSADSVLLQEEKARSNDSRTRASKNGSSVTNVDSSANGTATLSTIETKKTNQLTVVPLAEAVVDSCGSKAARCADLERLAAASGKGLFTTPKGAVLPFGCMEAALQSSNLTSEYQACLSQLQSTSLTGSALDDAVARMAEIIQRTTLPQAVLKQVSSVFPDGSLLAVRSSANVEDLAGMSAAGLYESKVGVSAGDAEALSAAIKQVWASLYSRRAVLARRAAGMSQDTACMAVLLMELISPEISFVLHTARPRDNNKNIILAELAPGQGETLASGTRGSPWRLEIEKATSKVDTLAFANFSTALVAADEKTMSKQARMTINGPALRYSSFDELHGGDAANNGTVATTARTQQLTRSGLLEVEIDYSKQKLSTDREYREQVGRQLLRVGMVIEEAYGREPQDIEGGLVAVGSDQLSVVIVQTRPQS